jgi:signal transduction histidine kinase/CheY-like chemotaxis protein
MIPGLPADERAVEVARLRQFIAWDMPANVAGLTLMLVLFVLVPFPYFPIIGASIAMNMGVLVWAYRRAETVRVSLAITVICLWLLVIVLLVAYALPVVFPLTVLFTLWPVTLALPYYSARSLRRLMAASILVLCAATVLSLRDQPYRHLLPDWLVSQVMVSFAPVIMVMLFLMLWHYHSRLNETVARTREANLALLESERVLEARVTDRTAELQEKSNQLEIANRHKSEFLASMSHELRTPLNAVIGFSRVLADRTMGDLNQKQQEYLDDIISSGNHLLSLISDVLDLSKVEAGRMEVESSRFSLREAFASSFAMVKDHAARRQVSLALRLDPEVEFVDGDERKVKQVLFNLLSNAVKFTRTGGSVAAVARRAGDQVSISVRDTGIGIAAEHLEKVFEDFHQVRSHEPEHAQEGSGLGLALAKRLVELHGGRIRVESEVDEGSTFTLTLPLTSGALQRAGAGADVDPAPGGHARQEVDAAHRGDVQRGTDLVLIIEDNERNLKLVRDLLHADRLPTVEARTAAQGLALARVHRPRLILMDIKLPDLDGVDALRLLRADPATATIPVLAVTAFAMALDRQRFLDAGFDGYITKPILVAEFPGQVRAALRDGRLERAPARGG